MFSRNEIISDMNFWLDLSLPEYLVSFSLTFNSLAQALGRLEHQNLLNKNLHA